MSRLTRWAICCPSVVVAGQSLSCVQIFATPWTIAHSRFPCYSLSPRVCSDLFHWVSDVIQASHPLSPLLFLPSIFPSIRVFPSNSAFRIRQPKYWSFSFSISPSNENSGLISFRIDCFDLLAVQGTQEISPTPQFESINSSVLSLLYGPSLTSVHDYWKNHSFGYRALDDFAF